MKPIEILNIYLIELKTDVEEWDCDIAHVVIAKTEERARDLCAIKETDQGSQIWTNPEKSEIKILGTSELVEQIAFTSILRG